MSHSEAAKVYAELVSRLHDDAGEMSAEEYGKLFAVVEQWRVRAESERQLLAKHIKQHGCSTEATMSNRKNLGH